MASQKSQEVLYITERGVFKLSDGELELIEIAPGINLKDDIMENMGFLPKISPRLTLMDTG